MYQPLYIGCISIQTLSPPGALLGPCSILTFFMSSLLHLLSTFTIFYQLLIEQIPLSEFSIFPSYYVAFDIIEAADLCAFSQTLRLFLVSRFFTFRHVSLIQQPHQPLSPSVSVCRSVSVLHSMIHSSLSFTF